jgi:hypothetical protein
MQLKNETMLAIGVISIALGVLIGKFTYFEYGGILVSDFLEGFFVGLAIVLNLAYMVRVRIGNKTNAPATK